MSPVIDLSWKWKRLDCSLIMDGDLKGSQNEKFTTSNPEVVFCWVNANLSVLSVWEGLSFSLWRPSASHPHPRQNLPYTSRDASKFLAKWSLFFEERRKGIPHQGDTIPPFTVAWLWNFTGDGRNGRHSILLPPSNVTHQAEGEEKRERERERCWSGMWQPGEEREKRAESDGGVTQFLSIGAEICR